MADIAQTAPALGLPFARQRPRSRRWRGHLQGSEYSWAIAFCVPYVAILLAFVVYPIGFGIWMGSDPELYRRLFADPIYVRTAINTAVYVGVTINVKMLLALALSGFFMRAGWWS